VLVAVVRSESRASAIYAEAVTFPPDVLESVLARSTSHTSSLHGLGHWERVRENGLALAGTTDGADVEVVLFFALFHDSMRENDGHDPGHGRRGSALARELARVLPLESLQLDLLTAACDGHTEGFVSDDPTVGACWDADRLDLPRVGIQPDRRFLSTAAARERAALVGRSP
jgi:uncharacterized protein